MASGSFCLQLTVTRCPDSREPDTRNESEWERVLPGNEKGFQSEFGPRNYRPEYPKLHQRQHFVFKPNPRTCAEVVKQLQGMNGAHRAAFVAAANAAGGLFLDLMQIAAPIPIPAPPTRWCAVLNDDEPASGGARGPSYFHQTTLITLVSSVRTIVVTTVGARAQLYLIAVDRLVRHRENCLVIETQPEFASDWMAFLALHTIDCRVQAATPSPGAHDFLVSTLTKQRDALLGS